MERTCAMHGGTCKMENVGLLAEETNVLAWVHHIQEKPDGAREGIVFSKDGAEHRVYKSPAWNLYYEQREG